MIVWLASYPRSGNTFLRVILNNSFGIKTHSIYDDRYDIGADQATSDIVGHKFLPKDFDINNARLSEEVYYIKTHELLDDMELDKRDKVIYLVRDGRESCLSFFNWFKSFSKGNTRTLSDIIVGNTPYGSWGTHVMQWSKVDYLLIKFEDFISNPLKYVKELELFLQIPSIGNKIPGFKELQKINPKFFRSGKKASWKDKYTEYEKILFMSNNISSMKLMGYPLLLTGFSKDEIFDNLSIVMTQQKDVLSERDIVIEQLRNKYKELKKSFDEVKKKHHELSLRNQDLTDKIKAVKQISEEKEIKYINIKKKLETQSIKSDLIVKEKENIIKNFNTQSIKSNSIIEDKNTLINNLNSQMLICKKELIDYSSLIESIMAITSVKLIRHPIEKVLRFNEMLSLAYKLDRERHEI